jgi:hypothetical protein
VNDGTVLYGHDHLKRIVLTGQAENLKFVQRPPTGTRCVAAVGGVMIFLPRQPAAV